METVVKAGTKTGLLNIINVLESIYSRPGMYIGQKDDVEGILNFMHGFLIASDALGFAYSRDISRQVLVENDWRTGPSGVWLEMREKSMSEEEIVREIVLLEIKKWKRLVTILLASE